MNKYLYEIIEDYKTAKTANEKETIFKSFCKGIWGCDNKRRVVTKTIKFKVKDNLLETDLGELFVRWTAIGYKTYNPIAAKSNWYYIIRQKINNIYIRYFDKEVILNSEYMNLLNVPKKLYYRWINGAEMNLKETSETISETILKSGEVKKKYQMQKIDMPWNEYKKIIEGVLRKIFNRAKLISEYENDNKDKLKNINLYGWNNEDAIYISYFCKSIEGEMMMWQKEYYGVRQHKKYKLCQQCGSLIENTGNKRLYCDKCAKILKKDSNRRADKKYKNKKRENRKP